MTGRRPPARTGRGRVMRRMGDGFGRRRPPVTAPTPLVALHIDGPVPDPRRVGAKAASLAWLASHRTPVPPAVAIPSDIVARIAAGDPPAVERVALALRRWLNPGRTYAVRPSPAGEDPGRRASTDRRATRLAVPPAGVMDAILAVVQSEAGPSAPLGVVVQEMIVAGWSGAAFSRNPLTGLDEVIIEAAARRTATPPADGDPPERWTRRWGAFTERPADPAVPVAVVEGVARETSRLAHARGEPVELAWAHDGAATWWLRARPMPALDDLHVYSNRIARDMLPGVIKPLVWSVNTSIVNAAWIELLEEVLGPLDLRPADLTRSFGYHAYFDMTAFGTIFERLGMPRDSLELMLGLPKGPETPRMRMSSSTMRHGSRMLAIARSTLSRGRWVRGELAVMQRRYEELAAVDVARLDETALLGRVDAIAALARRAAYANIVIPMVLLAYERTLWLQVRAAGLDPAAIDPAADRADRASWDPNAALDHLRELVNAMPEEERASLSAWRAQDPGDGAGGTPLHRRLDAFVTRFGHLSESNNDFSRPSWCESRDAVVDLVLAHPARARADRVGRTAVEARLSPWRRPAFRLLWRRTGAFQVYRAAVGATWSRSYGLLRGTFLALGSRLAAKGLLDQPDDVFYLALDELRALATDPGSAGDVRALVSRRRSEVAEAADLVMPDVVYGDAFAPRRRDGELRAMLEGIAASRGVASGSARVIRTTADFTRVSTGDVIVIPYSDVAWNPLFARAAGVVAEETGGILSHAAIVAREYGIPCVVGVSGACALIPDGASIVVDGAAGRVLVERGQPG